MVKQGLWVRVMQ